MPPLGDWVVVSKDTVHSVFISHAICLGALLFDTTTTTTTGAQSLTYFLTSLVILPYEVVLIRPMILLQTLYGTKSTIANAE